MSSSTTASRSAGCTSTTRERCTVNFDTGSITSGLSTLNEDQFAERGARVARLDDREYREYLREEQRSQPGCPAREVVLDQRGQATRLGRSQEERARLSKRRGGRLPH